MKTYTLVAEHLSLTFLVLWSKYLLLESVWSAVVYRYLFQKAESCLTPLPPSLIPPPSSFVVLFFFFS